MNSPIVHQDIKPDNIMRGNQGEYLITYFGVSTSLRSTLRRSTTGSINSYQSAGTMAYMAPERFGRKNKPIMANDVYSLGATMFEMLTGDVPFGDLGGIVYHQGAELPELDCNCSEQLKQVVERCLSREPWDRPVASKLEEWARIGLRGDKIDFGSKAITPDDSKPNTPPDKDTPDGRPTQIHPEPQPVAPEYPKLEPPKPAPKSKLGFYVAALVAVAVIAVAVVVIRSNDNANDSSGSVTSDVVVPTPANGTSESATSTSSSGRSGSGGKINGYSYVDLGLSVKWATCNVGANSPSDYGNYYAWGETTTKSEYTGDNSKTYGNSSYNRDIGGDASLDAARANWGGTWRLPTEAEFQELIDNCDWQWTTQGGHKGYKVTSKKKGYEGRSIFLPAAGWRYGSSLYSAGKCGDYWSSSPGARHSQQRPYLDFNSSNHHTGWYYRYYGFSVRPVSE